MIYRRFIIIAALIGALGVGLGAFGAHGLAATLAASERTGTFQTAAQYQMYHALALLVVGVWGMQAGNRWLDRAGWLFIAGVIVFCGSLYILAIFDLGLMGAVAPLGGAAFIGGWLCLGLAARQ